MGIDEERPGRVVGGEGRMAAEMDFPNMLRRKGVDIGARIKGMVGGGDKHVVDVQQQPAAGAASKDIEKSDLRHLVIGKAHIGRGVLDEDPASEGVLHFLDMGCNAAQGLGGIGQRQKIVEVGRAV
jgi:hypothetical protein